MAKVIVVLFSFVSVVIHAARTRQGQADHSSDEVAGDGCPDGSSGFDNKCVCNSFQQWEVCTIDGSLGCPHEEYDDHAVFFRDCERCSCVPLQDICQGGGDVTKSKEGAFRCRCDVDEVCTRGGTLPCPSPGEIQSSFSDTYPTDCEDCQCVQGDNVCPSDSKYNFGKCKCGLNQTCTRDGEFRNCGVERAPAEFDVECEDCHCVSDSSLPTATCPSGTQEESPDSSGDCRCNFESYCSTDDGASANCPSFKEDGTREFHHWCKDCKCYPDSVTSTTPPPQPPCPEFAFTVSAALGLCGCFGDKPTCQQAGAEGGSCSINGVINARFFKSSCDDCTCV